ncbi:MFS transporter [Crocinitomicaceae bacterium CZZ-1]|uniref:MFS transporter n=1 Tax=Taishania pollutisoli TaxID=2766479 RepID=A0A8J6PFH1_9FLAO|nr:MFS transporter [Taishania pollutisoli]MBC9813543.1 MFS transporter [Taishania pollutisoli]
MELTRKQKLNYLFSLPVIVAALGYFVDIYDLLLFSIVRIPSLHSMGLDVDAYGTMILNWEKTGLLLGGILWGIFGDKKGRLSVLFGSILVYSLANIACGLLPHVDFMEKQNAYALFRFVAGLGLAGELGAGITLVSESLPKELRAIGTSLVAGFGLMGAVVASLTADLASDWTVSYFIGGALGLMLLILRIGVVESGIYKGIEKNKSVAKGNFFSFFTNYDRFVRYMKCISIGFPTWFCIGILAVFANQFGPALGIVGEIDPGKAIMWAYVGISVGDFASGFISNWLQSRKKAIFYMMLFTVVGIILMLFGAAKTVNMYYFFCIWLGLGTGYWALFVTMGAEQFGTNIRATAATTIPNMVRGALILMIFLFNSFKPSVGVIWAAVVVGVLSFGFGIYSTLTVSETHNKDLDYTE